MSREAEELAAFVFSLVAMTLLCVVILLCLTWVVMLGWNCSMPHLFALPEASYRNAFGLTLLAWAARSASVTRTKEG